MSQPYGAIDHARYAEYGGRHPGIDYATPVGEPFVASGAGNVIYAGENPQRPARGIHVWLDHGDGVQTVYMHAKQLWVRVGDRVEAGQVLGQTGASGEGVTGPHMHWGVWLLEEMQSVMRGFVEPTPYLG